MARFKIDRDVTAESERFPAVNTVMRGKALSTQIPTIISVLTRCNFILGFGTLFIVSSLSRAHMVTER